MVVAERPSSGKLRYFVIPTGAAGALSTLTEGMHLPNAGWVGGIRAPALSPGRETSAPRNVSPLRGVKVQVSPSGTHHAPVGNASCPVYICWRRAAGTVVAIQRKQETTHAVRRPACRLIKLRPAAPLVAIRLSPSHRQLSSPHKQLTSPHGQKDQRPEVLPTVRLNLRVEAFAGTIRRVLYRGGILGSFQTNRPLPITAACGRKFTAGRPFAAGRRRRTSEKGEAAQCRRPRRTSVCACCWRAGRFGTRLASGGMERWPECRVGGEPDPA